VADSLSNFNSLNLLIHFENEPFNKENDDINKEDFLLIDLPALNFFQGPNTLQQAIVSNNELTSEGKWSRQKYNLEGQLDLQDHRPGYKTILPTR
jgi:hypothetical protein